MYLLVAEAHNLGLLIEAGPIETGERVRYYPPIDVKPGKILVADHLSVEDAYLPVLEALGHEAPRVGWRLLNL